MAEQKLNNVNLQQLDEVAKTTGASFNELWWNNFLQNQELIKRNRGVGILANGTSFKDVSTILVGAGPSLDKLVPFLIQESNKSLIIACDAILEPLLDMGVTPHIVITLDPQKEIARFFASTNTTKPLLIAPTIIHPEVLRFWKGKLLFYNKNAPVYPVLVNICNHAPHIPQLTPGGSVLSVGYDLAFKLGCDPIIFIGQDLAYVSKKTHAKNTAHPINESNNILLRMKEHIVLEEDIFGKKVPTSKALSTSKDWFHWIFNANKKHRDSVAINASESGIIKENCDVLTFRDALSRKKNRINVENIMRRAMN
ncbi:MAG: DUF115 domain-containing protein [Nitrospinae bacterium]|nr:DUF115 domain-containing protein [Nitrospinota bacterium]